MAEQNLTAKLELTADGNAPQFLENVMKAVGGLADRLGGGGSLEKLLGGVGAGMMGIVAGAAAAIGALALFVTKTIGAASATEKLELQIASFIQRNGAWADATARSILIVRELDQVSLRTGEDVDVLGATFRSLAAIVGGSDKQLEAMTEQLSVLGKLAGTSSKEILTVFEQAALTGTVRGPEAKELLSRFAMTPEQIRQAYLTGDLLAYLTKKIGDLKGPSDALASSWDVLMQVFKTGSHQVLSDLGAAFEPMKQGLIGVRDALASDAVRGAIRDVATTLRQVVSAAVDMKNALAELIPFKEIFTVWGGLLKVVATQWVTLTGAAEMFITTIVGAKDIVKEFLFGGKDSSANARSQYHELLMQLGADAQKTADRVKAIWDPDQGPAAAAGSSKKGPPFVDEKALRENYKNVTDMFTKLKDEVLSTGTGPDWEKAQSKIQVHVDDLQKAFRLLSQNAHNLGRDLPQADVDSFNALLAKLKGNLGAEEWLKLSDAAKTASLSLKGLAASTAEEFTAVETGQREFDLTKLERAANVLPEIFRKPLLAIVDSARDALERDLPAIVQRGLEKAAALAYAQAVTIGDGVRAALLKITSSLKTEGQIWADYLGGIWSGITSGLGTVLNTLETGTGTIKDALKGILNSLLQSFNQMVVEMVKRWLLGKREMAGGSPLDSLFGGGTKQVPLDATGNVKLPTGWSSSQVQGGQAQGGPSSGLGVAGAVGGAVAGYGVGSAVGGMSGAPGFATGAAIGGVVGGVVGAAVGASLLAELGPTILGLTATGYGIIVAAVIAVIAGLIAVLSQPNTEMHIFGRDFAPQIKMAAENVQSGLVDVFAKSLLPDAAGFAKSMNDRIRAYLAKANLFEVHAGEQSDMEADLKRLLTGIIPAELLHTLIGQRVSGGQDVAGISGASKYDQFLDPNAPINKMLTDLGFTAKEVEHLAGQIDTLAPEDWMKMLSGLVGVVAGAGTLGKLLSKTYAETIADSAATTGASPAGKLSERFAAVSDLLKAVSFYTGTEQITKGQEAIQAAQQFYSDAKAAMLQLSAMAKQTTQEYLDSTKKIEDALKSPAELFAQSTADLQHDYERMRFAANPEDLAAGWAKARTDFEAVAGELVNRIKAIRSLLDDIHTLQAAMAAGPGADAQTDPKAWLSQNLVAMAKYRIAMTNATPGSPEQIAAATSFAGLLRDRYQMELEMLGRVKSAIESVNQTIDDALFNINVTEAGTNQDKAGVVYARIQALFAQLQSATSPEQITAITSQITGLSNQLLGLSPAGSPGHADAVKFVEDLLETIRSTSNQMLGTMGANATTDISKLGPQLAAAEAIMQTALTAASNDLVDLEWHFKMASEFATSKLNLWGVEIAAQLNALGPILTTMVGNFTDVNTALQGSGGAGGGKHGPDGFIPVIQDATVAISDFAGRLRAGPGAGNVTAGGGGVSVTANVTVNQGGEVDLDAIWDGLEPSLLEALRRNNIKVLRHANGAA